MNMNILSELRETTKTPRRVLADVAGVSYIELHRHEQGKVELSVETMEKISVVLASKLSAAYIAGLFDRMSSWSIAKVLPNKKHRKKTGNTGPINFPVYSARIRFITKHRLLAEVFKKFFGVGFIHPLHNQWNFFAANRKAKEVAEKLLPYLILKRDAALDIIETVDILESRPGQGKAILAVNLKYSTVKLYQSTREAASALGIAPPNITDCLQEKQHTCKNETYTFQYAPEELKDRSYLVKLERLFKQMSVRNGSRASRRVRNH